MAVDVAYDPTATYYRSLRPVDRSAMAEHLRTRVDRNEAEAVLALHDLARTSELAEFRARVAAIDARTLAALPVALPQSRPTYFEDAAKAHAAVASLLKGKRVVLTGPAAHGLDSRASDVESFDLVARLNFQWPLPPEHEARLGKRCDLLFHCCNGDFPVEILDQPALATVRFAFLEQGLQSVRLERLCAARGVPVQLVSSIYEAVRDVIGAPPSTGLVAVHHLLSYEVAALHLVGMTFGRTPYYAGYRGTGAAEHAASLRTGRLWHHDVGAEVDAVRALLRRDARLTLDPEAARILSR
jgi:hypothetical protein